MHKFLFFTVISVLFIACKDAALPADFVNDCYFESPLPIHDSELTKVPAKFLGQYMNEDSVYLSFKENIILIEKMNAFNISKTDFDSIKNDFEITNGQYVLKLTKDVYQARILRDSIQLTTKDIDTLFVFSAKQKAKRILGHLVLSEKDSIFWTIKLITLADQNLQVTRIYSQDDIKRMDSITKIKSKMIDSSFYIINPSRKEFKHFFKLRNFGYTQNFKKIPL